MDYKQANEKLQGRCQQSRKLQNNTYLHRDANNTISLRLHSTDVITWHPNGSIQLNSGGWNTVTTKERINGYQPYRVWSERGQLFLQIGDWRTGKTYAFRDYITITKRGRVIGAGDLESIYAGWKEEDRENARISRWLSKARGLKRTKKCDSRYRYQCDALQGRGGFGATLRGPGEYKCGCVIERVQPKTKLTVSEIMAEPNITVRMAMVHVYGLDRFLLDAEAKTIDSYKEYALLDLPMGDWQTIRALKMTCPSTNTVYISPVEPHVRNVSEALDWYFQTENYLQSLTQES